MEIFKRISTFNSEKNPLSIHLRTWETLRTTFDLPTAQVMVKEAVLPAVNLSFERSVDEVSEVLMTPLELLFTDLTRVTFLAPDFPVTEQVALRALETV